MKKVLSALLFFLLLPLTVNAQHILFKDEKTSYTLESYTVTRTDKYDQIDSISFVVNITDTGNPILDDTKVQYFFDLTHQGVPIAGDTIVLLPETYDKVFMFESLRTIDKNMLLEKTLLVAEKEHEHMPYNENYYFWRENNLVATYLDANLPEAMQLSADNELQILDVFILNYYTKEGAAKITRPEAQTLTFRESYRFDLVNNRYMLLEENWRDNNVSVEIVNLNENWLDLYPENPSQSTQLAQSILAIGLMNTFAQTNDITVPITMHTIDNWSPEKYDINLEQ